MFENLCSLTSIVSLAFSNKGALPAFFHDYWEIIMTELFILQTAFTYSVYRLMSHKNYFRQVIALLNLLCVLVVYLAFMQAELFACFMFVAEFTIVIFFYSLFLHLRVSLAQTEYGHKASTFKTNAIITLILIAGTLCYGALLRWGEMSLVHGNLYNNATTALLNDLVFFAATVMRANPSLHYVVGLLLLFMTFFLFYTVNVYYFLNVSRRDAILSKSSKLASGRGYYEQTAEEVQKVIGNTPKKP